MFRPNQNCTIRRSSSKTDVYGQPLPGSTVSERCAIVKLNVQNMKSSVRADTTASRGTAQEKQVEALILLDPKTVASIDDIMEVHGVVLRIVSMFPRHSVSGQLDHYEVTGTIWE